MKALEEEEEEPEPAEILLYPGVQMMGGDAATSSPRRSPGSSLP